MTTLVNVNGPGRAYLARQLGERAANGKLHTNKDAAFNAVASIAHTHGACIIERNGKRLQVQAKWLLPILRTAIDHMEISKRNTLLQNLLGVAQRSSAKCIFVTRKQIEWLQSYA